MKYEKFNPEGKLFRHCFDIKCYRCSKDNRDGTGIFIDVTDKVRCFDGYRETLPIDYTLSFDEVVFICQ